MQIGVGRAWALAVRASIGSLRFDPMFPTGIAAVIIIIMAFALEIYLGSRRISILVHPSLSCTSVRIPVRLSSFGVHKEHLSTARYLDVDQSIRPFTVTSPGYQRSSKEFPYEAP